MGISLRKLSRIIVDSPYFSRWIVLGLDTLLSGIATVGIFLILGFYVRSTVPLSAYVSIFFTSYLVSGGIFIALGTYRGVMRHTTMHEIWRVFVAVIIKSIILAVIFISLYKYYGFTIGIIKVIIAEMIDISISITLLILMRVFLILIYQFALTSITKNSGRVLVYGSDNRSISVVNYLTRSKNISYSVIGYVIISDSIKKLKIGDLQIYTIDSYKYFMKVITSKRIDAIIFPDQKSALKEKERLIDYCLGNRIKILIMPQLSEVSDTGSVTAQIREIKIEDLLGRDEIKIDEAEIHKFISGKTVMVTGGAGSIGSELCRIISSMEVKRLVVLDNAETPLHNIKLELLDAETKSRALSEAEVANKYKFVIADVRSKDRIERVFATYKPDIIFHAAAYKHVPMMELNPCEAIYVNVVGTRNVADCAVKYGAEKMIMVSTDKAVNPTNVMGCSKRLAEIYVQSLSKAIIGGNIEGKTKFITTRFGNVLGSNGSVIPRFREQIMAGGPVTVTHKDIIRYFMTIPEACRLVLEAATMGEGYEIFVFDMGKPVKIADLARNMISLAGFTPDVDIKIEYTGLRPGEKLYEELLNDKECVIPTANSKISVAKVREYKYSDVVNEYDFLKKLAKSLDNMETVRCMKHIVPEFKSQNSLYSSLDI
jgi:FlaA1/EpsC-like NDP-sugar epimerase